MRFAKYWQQLRNLSWQRQPKKSRRLLFLEYLEDRTVPTVIWSTAGSRMVMDQGGPVITHVDVDLVFWGSGWNNSQALMNNVSNSANTIMDSPYLSGLSQYRGVGNGQLLRTDLITSTSPAAHTTSSQYDAFVKANINNGTLPVTPNMDGQILYMVIPQPGTTDPAEGAGGAHDSDLSNFGRFHYGWSVNANRLDDITDIYSHELTESVTDPEVNFRNAFVIPSTHDEIGDGEAQRYSYRLNGVLVQSSLSQKDHAYDIYDGNTQNFVLTSGRALTVNGDQLADPNDTVTVDVTGSGYTISLNGEVVQFDSGQVFSITINTLGGDDTVNIERTMSLRPVTVNLGNGTDTVNLSPADQNLSNLAGAVTVSGGSGTGTLNLFDRGTNNNQNYTVTGSTVARSGMTTVAYNNLANVSLNTSNGIDTITVESTPAGTAVAVNGGTGTDTLDGSAADNAWSITDTNAGTLSSPRIAGLVTFTSVQNLTGGVANNTFVFSDGASISGNINGGGGGSLDFSAYTTDVSVNLQMATATGVGGTITGIRSLTGGGGNNSLVGADVSNLWNLTGSNAGSVTGTGTVAFTAFQNLTGGAAANTFVFSDGAGISGNLDGGSGGTSLDYSAYSTSVIVDLQTATATGVGGTVANIQIVTGGTGGGAGVYNILIGSGSNTLNGGFGRRNILVAGASASTLNGGDGEDLLIGGSTAYDTEAGLNTWQQIAAYWAGSDDYGSRVAKLTSGTGVPLLDATVVTANGGSNTLNGNGALALLYTNGQDTIAGLDPGSQRVTIAP